MNRVNAVTFRIPNQFENITANVLSLLRTKSNQEVQHSNYCLQLDSFSILWICQDVFDSLCQNSEFWEYLKNSDMISVRNFNVKCYKSKGSSNDNLSNDNKNCYTNYTSTEDIGQGFMYLSNADYQSNYILTAGYINNKSYIKTWIAGRGLEDSFDLTKTVAELKEDLIAYYNLGDNNEIA